MADRKDGRLGVVLVVVVLIVMIAVLVARRPRAPERAAPPAQPSPTALTQEQLLERGRYLVEGPAHCIQCHSPMDVSRPGFPPQEGLVGAGFEMLDHTLPFVHVPNITPDPETGSGNWDDEVFVRVLRQGIGHDGRTLFPLMAYPQYRNLTEEDLRAIITYVRSLPPVKRAVKKTELPPPIQAALQPLPPLDKATPQWDMADPMKRGEYLVTIGNCAGCHIQYTPQGEPVMQLAYAGGARLLGVWGDVVAPNITQDPTGISYYDEAMFVQVMRTGKVGARELNSVMPWYYFRNMTDDDLKAIWAYLRSLPPVRHRVDNTEPPTPCKICNGVHGAGETN